MKAIPEALPKILDFVQGIGDKLAEAAPILIQKGFELLQKLVEGIITAVPIFNFARSGDYFYIRKYHQR